MKLILDGLDPIDRRVLILLPCGDEPVGMRVSTVVKSVLRNGLEFWLTVTQFSDKTGSRIVGNLRFDLGTKKLFAVVVNHVKMEPKKEHPSISLVSEPVECFMVLDTKDGMTVPDLLRLYQIQFPDAHEVLVE